MPQGTLGFWISLADSRLRFWWLTLDSCLGTGDLGLLSSLIQLTKLSLYHGSKLTGTLKPLSGHTQLTELRLCYCQELIGA